MDRIDALRAFSAVAETGSFSEAAKRLRINQSTVSKWIRRLETEMGSVLLERSTRMVRLTDAGILFRPRAAQTLHAYEDAVQLMRDQSSIIQGTLRINMPVVFGAMYIAPLLPDFLRQHPALHIEVNSSDRYDDLLRAQADVILRVGEPVDSSLRCHPLARCPRRIVASPAYWERTLKPKVPSDLERCECLNHIPGQDAWRFRKRKQSFKVQVGGRVRVNSSEVARQLSVAGLGVACLASWLVDEDISKGRLQPVLEGFEMPEVLIQALTAPGRRASLPARRLIDYLRSKVKNLTSGDSPP